MKTVRLVTGYLRHNMMSAMAYRGAFVLQVFGMALNDAMLLFFWWVLFTQFPTLRGWTMVQVMTLYAVSAFAYGVANVVCGNAFWVARVIVRGDLDYYLALPADPLIHVLVSRMSLSGLGRPAVWATPLSDHCAGRLGQLAVVPAAGHTGRPRFGGFCRAGGIAGLLGGQRRYPGLPGHQCGGHL